MEDSPSHLSAPSRALYRRLTADYALGPAELALLTLACEALDRASTARRTLKREGMFVASRANGKLPHPGVRIANDSASLAARILKQLGLADDAGET